MKWSCRGTIAIIYECIDADYMHKKRTAMILLMKNYQWNKLEGILRKNFFCNSINHLYNLSSKWRVDDNVFFDENIIQSPNSISSRFFDALEK